MALADFFTGGKNDEAQRYLQQAQTNLREVGVPTVEQLTLPQLQQYVQAGIMTPEEAQAYLQKSNAYEAQNIPQVGNDAMISALNELSSIADAGPMGTPLEQAQSAQTIQQLNNAVQGQRGAIEQQMQAKGTPAAMIQAALQSQYVGQDAQQAYHNSLDQQAAAYQAAVQALAAKGGLGGQLQGQQNQQANTVANAQNAMQQFNAANQQQNSQFNAANRQVANAANLQNAQNVSNQNTQNANSRTEYNTGIAQQRFQDQMQKATGQANVAANQSNQATQAGQQEAGLWSGIIGAGATLMGGPVAGYAAKNAMDETYNTNVAEGGILSHDGCYHDGGICMDDGGMVPGEPEVPGNSLENDTVHVMASPGEAVIPRTAVQENLPQVLGLIAEGRGEAPRGTSDMNPSDVATVLQALRELRMGVAA